MKFRETLIRYGLVDEDNIKIVANPTLATMKYEIRTFFGNTKPSDTLIFFFSGHGYYDQEIKKTYFITYDTKPDAISDTAYPVDDHLMRLVRDVPSKVIMFIDACYSGSIGKKKPIRLVRFGTKTVEETARIKETAFIFLRNPIRLRKDQTNTRWVISPIS